jgi:hypothetical protein
MYEFAVTLRYLHGHPDEAETFLAYHLVQQDKLVSRTIETSGEASCQPIKSPRYEAKLPRSRKISWFPFVVIRVRKCD